MSTLIIDTEKYVFSLLNKDLDRKFVYHNLEHTQRVVKSIKELTEHIQIDELSAENIQIAAWFHDTGFIKTTENHEEKSVQIAAAFLKENQVSDDRIKAISALILATKMGSHPKDDLEKIFGKRPFDEIVEKVKEVKEVANVIEEKIEEKENIPSAKNASEE